MISLKEFNELDFENQEIEIQHAAYLLELVYRAYDDTKLPLMRGQMWKLEKYLILFNYLHKTS